MLSQYQPIKLSDSIWFHANGLRLHVRHWKNNHKPKILFLHGWMDASVSFQFVIDFLPDDWDIYALDWRGMGLSEHQEHGYYDRAMMVSDLAQLIDFISVDEPIHLVGHSLGGMLASIYAAIKPHRVKSLTLAEAFGVEDEKFEKSRRRYRNFFEESVSYPKFQTLPSIEAYVKKLKKQNPLLSEEKAYFLATQLSKEKRGDLIYVADAKHRITQPIVYGFDFFKPYWQLIESPILWLEGELLSHNYYLHQIKYNIEKRYLALGSPKRVVLKGSGHMLQWEAAEDFALNLHHFLIEKESYYKNK